jgi:hypothetical protein
VWGVRGDADLRRRAEEERRRGVPETERAHRACDRRQPAVVAAIGADPPSPPALRT